MAVETIFPMEEETFCAAARMPATEAVTDRGSILHWELESAAQRQVLIEYTKIRPRNGSNKTQSKFGESGCRSKMMFK